MWIILFAALLPVAILLYYIYKKDRWQPEPTSQILKAFFYGLGSVFVSLIFSTGLGAIGLFPAKITSVAGALATAFMGAAIPEESAKLLMLLLFLRGNKYFDERMDGIVYAGCVSLGFAAFENVMYLFEAEDMWISTGIMRALLAVPGHCIFGILMGYYYALFCFKDNNKAKHAFLTLAVPVMGHGTYDALMMMAEVTPVVVGYLLWIAFLLFFYCMQRQARTDIDELQALDYEFMQRQEGQAQFDYEEVEHAKEVDYTDVGNLIVNPGELKVQGNLPYYHVVAAVVRAGSKYLCVQKGETKYAYTSLKWEFPGGKVEQGETEEEALRRELREEMDFDVRVDEHLATVSHWYPDFGISLAAYLCTPVSASFILREHKEARWLTLQELQQLDWAAADSLIVGALLYRGA